MSIGIDARRSKSAPARVAPWVGLLTVGWLIVMAALVWMMFGVGMEGWADQMDNGGARHAELAAKADRLLLASAAAAVGGPVAIAVVAFTGRLDRTGMVYLLLAAVLMVPAVYLVRLNVRPSQPAPEPLPSNYCVQHSGAGPSCPGG
jgi:hypothetical protein